jgi:hypothetical protein
MNRHVLAVLVALVMCRVAAADILIDRVGVEVTPLDSKGKAWDRASVGAAPDPRITIRIDGKRIDACETHENSLTSECDLPEMLQSASAVRLELQVDDIDITSNESIGEAHATIAPDASGRVELETGRQVVKAWAEVRQVAPFWMSERSSRLLASAAGALLALLAFAIGRRRFLTPFVSAAPDKLAPAVEASPHVRMWRSPVLLAGMACSLAGVIAANYLYAPTTQPLLAAIPIALGAFAVTGTVIDAFVHEHLGAGRTRVLCLGAGAMVAVPVLHSIGGIVGLAQAAIGLLFIAGLVWAFFSSL